MMECRGRQVVIEGSKRLNAKKDKQQTLKQKLGVQGDTKTQENTKKINKHIQELE